MSEDIRAIGLNADGTYDGTKVLSALSGGKLSPIDVKSIFEEVKANIAAWDSCPAPHHVIEQIGDTHPMKFRCVHCGGTKGTEVVQYIKGFEANGGDGSAIWSEWGK